jgi:antibiotic biosynthesis monooxygenase (ABM) superfamily enzyme
VEHRSHPQGDARQTAATLGAAWTPATAVITRDVTPGHQADYQKWSQRLLATAARRPGYQSATLVGPPHGDPGRRMLIRRFSDRRSLRTWVDSEQRKSLTAEADEFSTHVYEEPSSLETWFAIPGMGTVQPPPRWKMALATTPAAYVLILAILAALSPISESWPRAASNVVVTVLMVALLTWVAMPLVTRVLRPWLYPSVTRQPRMPRTRIRARFR